MKKIQRWIKSITLIILMIGAVTSVSAKTSFPVFQSDPQTNNSPDFSSHTEDITWNLDEENLIMMKIKVEFLDEKNLRVFYKREDNSQINLQFSNLMITLNGTYVYYANDIFDISLEKTDDFLEVERNKWKWTNDENFYDYTLSEIKKFNFEVHLMSGFKTKGFIFPLFNFNINRLFPEAPDYENLRIEKKSDTSADIFYAIEPTAPATIPAGYNFDFTRLEAEYASTDNPNDVQIIELSFNAQRQAYFAVLDNLEAEANYVINRLIWHYTLTDQSDSSKSYPLFSSLPLPPASNSFNLNNLVTDAYVISASGKPPATETSSNLTTIIGVSAGVGGSLLVFGGIGYWFYRRRKKS